PFDLVRRGRRGVDELEGAGMDATDGRLEEGIVRAAEHERVGAQLDDVSEVSAQNLLSVPRDSLARLDDVDQLGTRLLVHADHRIELLDRMEVLLAAHRSLGRDHSDAVVLRRLHGSLGAWTDDANDGHLEQLPRVVERRGGRRVAGDNNQLDVTRFEVADDVDREAAHLILVARAVRKVEKVRDVDRGLRRQPLADGLEHREAADARIEDPDGTLV